MSDYDATLAAFVANSPLTPDRAAFLLLPVAESLAHLHRRGRTHGAVSPASVIVEETGHARLLDPGRVARDPAYTTAGGIGATPETDVWALSGLLQFAATGSAPYSTAAGPRDMGWLTPIVALGLHPDPNARPTAEDVADYLRARVAPAETHRNPRLAAGIGAAVVVLLGVVGGLLLLGGGDDEDRSALDAPTSAPTRSSATPSVPVATETSPAGPTAAELEGFARTYVATASSDPAKGFTFLTRGYQQRSPRYREVWSAIEDPQLLRVQADPVAMSVSYTYRYRIGGSRHTEDVTLRLVQEGQRLLIADATSRSR